MKRFQALLICFILLTSSLSSVSAIGNTSYPTVTINGQELNVNVIIEKGYTLVPLRAIFEKFGAKVQYNEHSKTIVATKDNVVVTYMIGDNFAFANNKLINLKTLPVVKNGVTYIPLRFVAEAFEANILWNGSTKTVIIRSPEKNIHTSIAEMRSGWIEPQFYISKAMGFPDKKPILRIDVNVNQQVITLTNISNVDMDMTNWALKEYHNFGDFVFPKSFVLPVGQNVIISIGENQGDLNWNRQEVLIKDQPNRIDLINLNSPFKETVLMWEG